jgi:hypothetical protein
VQVSESYESWRPLHATDGEFFIVWFEHRPVSGAVLEVERLGGGPVLRVWFDDTIAFRMHPHDILMLDWWEAHSFYRVRDSSWAAWLERKSQGIWPCATYTHYGCKTIDGCYEVLAHTPPRAEWITAEQSLNPAVRDHR